MKVRVLDENVQNRNAKILNRAGKKGWKNKNWWNVQYLDETIALDSMELRCNDADWEIKPVSAETAFVFVSLKSEENNFLDISDNRIKSFFRSYRTTE